MGSKTPIDYLQDVFCDIPGLPEDLDQVITRDSDISGRDDFLGQVRQNALQHWKSFTPGDVDGRKITQTPHFSFRQAIHCQMVCLPAPFKQSFGSDPYRANELIVYDSVLLIVLRAAEGLGLNLGGSHSSMANPSGLHLPIQSNRKEVAVEVCRTVDYHLHCLQRSSGHSCYCSL
jgi:hypothetical protein